MKIACDCCERVADMDGAEFREEWRKMMVFRTRNEPTPMNCYSAEPITGWYLCDACYGKVIDTIMDKNTSSAPDGAPSPQGEG